MAPEPEHAVRAAAIAWHIRLKSERTDDWDAFMDWLSQDPTHSDAYDAVALADAELDPVLAEWTPPLVAANDAGEERSWYRRRTVLGGLGAVAATVLVGLVAGPALLRTDRFEIATRPGEHRIIELDGRDRIALNGSTRITLDKSNPRFASLRQGEATFTLVHDPKRPFTLELGDDRVQDVGTIFNVVRTADGQTVEVAEGAVVYNPQREAIAVAAGQSLTDRAGESRVILTRKDPSSIGSWRRGRLIYVGTPLSVVGSDLSRNLGVPVTVAPSISGQPFSGTIQIGPDQARTLNRLGEVLGQAVSRRDMGWMIGPRDRAVR